MRVKEKIGLRVIFIQERNKYMLVFFEVDTFK